MAIALDLRPSVTDAPEAPDTAPLAGDRGDHSIAQTAALLEVSRVSVSRWIRAGHLPVARLGHRTARVSRDDVERHGGRIRTEFPQDGGARFVVRRPLAPVVTE